METINARTPPRKPPSLEKFKETWLKQVIVDQRSLPPSAVYVAVAISFHMNRNQGGLAWPGMRRLADLTSMRPSTIADAVKRLEARRHLVVTRTKTDRRERGRNEYLPTLWDASTALAISRPTKRPTVTRVSLATVTRGSAATVTPCSAQTVTEPLSEPPTEPLREPLPQSATPCGVADSRNVSDKRVGDEGRKITTLIAKPNPVARCYTLVRKHWPGEDALVAKALRGGSAADVLDDLEQGIKEGWDLRETLQCHLQSYEAARA